MTNRIGLIIGVALLVAATPWGCDESSPSSSERATSSSNSEPENRVAQKGDDDSDTSTVEREPSASTTGGADVATEPEMRESAGDKSNATDVAGVPMIPLDQIPEQRRPQFEFAQQQVRAAPDSIDRICDLGLHYLAFGFNDEAVTCFSIAIEQQPMAMRFHYFRALAFEALDLAAKAREDFERALELNPDYVPAYVRLGMLIQENDPKRAAALFEQATRRDANDAVAWFGRGQVAKREGKTDEAIAHWQKAIALQPDYADAQSALAAVYEGQGKEDLAQKHRRRAELGGKPVVQNDPLAFQVTRRTRDQDSIALEAVEMARKGNPIAAARYLEAAQFHGIESESIRLALGGFYLDAGKTDEAIGQFLSAMRSYPDSVDVKLALARAYAESGMASRSFTLFDEMISADSESAKVLMERGRLYAREGEPQKALADLRKAADLAPNDAAVRFDLIELLLLMNDIDGAEQALQQTPKEANTAGRRLLFEGAVAARRGETSSAEAKWRAAIETEPTLVMAYQSLAQSMQQRGNVAAALEVLLAGIELVPAAADLQNNAAWILSTATDQNQRDGKLALELATRACALTGNRRHNFVGTLAAAHAEAGDFDEAARLAENAARLAEAAGLTEVAEQHRARMKLYSKKQAWRQ